MLEDTLKTTLRDHLERLAHPVELVVSLDDSEASAQLQALAREIAELSPRLSLRLDGHDARRPSLQITRAGEDMGVRFAAVPLGHEFSSLVLALLHAGGHPPRVEPGVVEQIQALGADSGRTFVFETWMSLSCHNCPDVVQALNLMAVLNPRVRHVAIDGSLFRDEAQARAIMAVPMVMLDGHPLGSGRMELAEILAKVDAEAGARQAAQASERLAQDGPLDVLVVGGGPAGAAAAIYAARKGIRTAVVAERFGGQTLDTLGIENFVSVAHTEGPKFAAALEAHVREYGVPILAGQRAVALEPASAPQGLATLRLASGASLQALTVVLATGARWREIGVPGEQEYRTRGVAYCPHCDGPLFKGRRVAVIGGGNSGVEAAIDLAGIVEHVTLLEYAKQLKADAVLVRKLQTLPNVTVHLHAQTLQVEGDGRQVTGLLWRDRGTGVELRTALAGVFVQIGLVPGTDWLKGTLELNRHGEIIVDERAATSAPGVFAAGDATTVPYKQIVIAAGDGAKAALAAFDHLMRH